MSRGSAGSKRRLAQKRGKPAKRSTSTLARAAWWALSGVVLTSLLGLTCAMCAPPRAAPIQHVSPPSPRDAARLTPAPSTSRDPSAASPLSRSIHVALGIPTDSDPSDDYLMNKGAYVVSYNPVRKVPNWVSWNLNRAFLGSVRRRDKFVADPELPTGFARVSPSDYARSGYDRGHMCPSADRSDSAEDNARTFLMTNMQPQLHELNDGPWRQLEEHSRSLARSGKELFIVAGGVFSTNAPTIGHGVAVPDASYKIIAALEPGQRAVDVNRATPTLAVVMPNRPGVGDKTWQQHVVSVDEVERLTGYDYLSAVAAAVQQVIESRVSTEL